MEVRYAISILVGILLGAVVIYLYMKSKLQHANEKIDLLTSHHTKEIEKQKETGLSLVTYPYKIDHAKNGVWDERRVEIGYKYQLFVNGTPCLQPHVVTTEILTKKDLNGERIDYAFRRATETALQLAELHPAIKALTTTYEVKSIVQKAISNSGA